MVGGVLIQILLAAPVLKRRVTIRIMRQRVRYNFRGTALGNAADTEYENSPFRRQACLAKPAFLGGGEPRDFASLYRRTRDRERPGPRERKRERERGDRGGGGRRREGGSEKPDGAVKTATSEEDGRNL
jgi:hypothetical protein